MTNLKVCTKWLLYLFPKVKIYTAMEGPQKGLAQLLATETHSSYVFSV